MVYDKRDDDDSLEIKDVEDYRSDKMQQFNHQALVMEVLRKAHEAGCHEMRTGWFNEKADNQGNITRTYVEDTRSRFIESVKTVKLIMKCDFDVDAGKRVKAIFTKKDAEKKRLLELQNKWWNGLGPNLKQNAVTTGQGISDPLSFNIDLLWYQYFIEFEVECWREVLEELHILTKRLDFYQGEEFVG